MAVDFLRDDALWRKLEDRSMPEPNSGCLLWMLSVYPNGYGSAYNPFTGKVGRAHRFAWRACRGPIPVGLSVLHKCDVPSCLNPNHLFLGTQAVNIADKEQKGRGRRGERHGMAKLTESAARAIKFATGPQTDIALAFRISKQTVNNIKRGRAWCHIT